MSGRSSCPPPEPLRQLDVRLVRIDRKLRLDPLGSLRLLPEDREDDRRHNSTDSGELINIVHLYCIIGCINFVFFANFKRINTGYRYASLGF